MTNFSQQFNSNAFLPFYDEPIQLKTRGGMNTTIYVCVFSDDNMDAISEGDFDNLIEQVSIHIKPKDNDLIRKVKRGDEVMTKDGKVFAVSDIVDDRQVGLVVKARLKK